MQLKNLQNCRFFYDIFVRKSQGHWDLLNIGQMSNGPQFHTLMKR